MRPRASSQLARGRLRPYRAPEQEYVGIGVPRSEGLWGMVVVVFWFRNRLVEIAVVELRGQMRSMEEVEGRNLMAFVELVVLSIGSSKFMVLPRTARAVTLLSKKIRWMQQDKTQAERLRNRGERDMGLAL